MYEPRRRRYNRDSVSIGRFAGEESDTEYTVSAGRRAGYQSQAQYAIAIGDRAGEETQQLAAIAVGARAGNTSQSQGAIAVGQFSGEISQGQNTIAIGEKAGNATQKEYSIAIGAEAGKTAQGKYAIAIGTKAGLENQPDYSIVISSSESDVKAKKKGLYIDPIRKFDDREGRPSTVKEGNILSYNHKNDTEEATKEVVTGFPRLPSYPTDAEVALAFTAAGGTLDQAAAGTMYFDSTKKKIKVYEGTKWVALADEEDIRRALAALAAAAGAGSRGSYVTGSGVGNPQGGVFSKDGFVTGPTGMAGGGGGTLYMPDGSVAREGIDYYLELVPGYGRIGDPVFYKDITLVKEDRVGGNSEYYPDGGLPENRPGFNRKTYDNGHVILEQIPTAQWNPPLAAWNNLPADERRALTQEYAEARGFDVMLGGDSGNVNAPNTFESDAFRSYLESKGLG